MGLSFTTYWLLSPAGGLGVNWDAGTELASNKGVWTGGGSGCSIEIKRCGGNTVEWTCTSGSEANLGGALNHRYDGPDTFIWFKHKVDGRVIGGFLDHWTLDRPRLRSFGNIKGLWHMNPRLILATAGEAQFGLCGTKGGVKTPWFKLG